MYPCQHRKLKGHLAVLCLKDLSLLRPALFLMLGIRCFQDRFPHEVFPRSVIPKPHPKHHWTTPNMAWMSRCTGVCGTQNQLPYLERGQGFSFGQSPKEALYKITRLQPSVVGVWKSLLLLTDHFWYLPAECFLVADKSSTTSWQCLALWHFHHCFGHWPNCFLVVLGCHGSGLLWAI